MGPSSSNGLVFEIVARNHKSLQTDLATKGGGYTQMSLGSKHIFKKDCAYSDPS
jgi:hypothetical protein